MPHPIILGWCIVLVYLMLLRAHPGQQPAPTHQVADGRVPEACQQFYNW